MKQHLRKLAFCHRFLVKSAIATLATSSLLIPSLTSAVQATMKDSPKTVVDEVWQIVNHEFVDRNFNQVNWLTVREELLSQNYQSNDEAYQTIRKKLKELGDPYTRFLDPQEFQQLTSQTSGEVSGIGIRLEINDKTNILTVVEPLPNSPASEAGIKPGDQILKIDGKPTALMTLEQASTAIRGESGTKIKLQVSRPSQDAFDVTLTRTQIELPSVSYTVKQDAQMRVGYIKLDEFSSHAAEQMQKAITDLDNQDVSAFVLDLRGNPGGLLVASVDIARMWMETGEIVHTVDRSEGNRKFSANSTAITNLPLVVLVDENSASASEILAGALKDNNRATIVGTRTYGKGTVQSVHSLDDGSGLAVTIARYFPPSGININKHGIMPDVERNLTTEDQLRLQIDPSLWATAEDPQYMEAIAVLKNPTWGRNQKPVTSVPSISSR